MTQKTRVRNRCNRSIMRLSDKIAWVNLPQPHDRPAFFLFRVYYLNVISQLTVRNAMNFFQAEGAPFVSPGASRFGNDLAL